MNISTEILEIAALNVPFTTIKIKPIQFTV